MATLRYMAKDQLEYPNKIELGSVTQYAQKWDIARDLVYDRLAKGTLTAYEVAELDGKNEDGSDKLFYRYFVDLSAEPQKSPYHYTKGNPRYFPPKNKKPKTE